jgi:hypothetical protein
MTERSGRLVLTWQDSRMQPNPTGRAFCLSRTVDPTSSWAVTRGSFLLELTAAVHLSSPPRNGPAATLLLLAATKNAAHAGTVPEQTASPSFHFLHSCSAVGLVWRRAADGPRFASGWRPSLVSSDTGRHASSPLQRRHLPAKMRNPAPLALSREFNPRIGEHDGGASLPRERTRSTMSQPELPSLQSIQNSLRSAPRCTKESPPAVRKQGGKAARRDPKVRT